MMVVSFFTFFWAWVETGTPATSIQLSIEGRELVILGYFTSEEVGTNVLHYNPVPGRYNGCVPIEAVGQDTSAMSARWVSDSDDGCRWTLA